ncbi:hypothetical protein DICVIV_04642 [Dictyocaulus viviparus]|uniref:RING-type domain-containing protein n=1 Tax=Dictyocaulus viviparus TaxID=29172 RepID=A0A0D8XZC2_DICVI|nr:hypothetical protein DICVIV_04642 [Dictyocaulus viviparus]
MNECSNGRLVSFLTDGDDVMSCEMCFEPFQSSNRTPKILPCGHNCCDQCLFSLFCHQKYYLLDSIKCPTCRRSFPTDVAVEAPTNWDLCKVLENVKQRREVNVTVIHVPEKPGRESTQNILSYNGRRRVIIVKKKPQIDRCGDCSRKLPHRILGKIARFCEMCNTTDNPIFYCLECCVNKHNGHVLLSLSELQAEQLKVLRELRELRQKLSATFQSFVIKQSEGNECCRGEDELNDGLISLDDAIQCIESTTLVCPKKLTKLRNDQVQICSRLFLRCLTSHDKITDISTDLMRKKFSVTRRVSSVPNAVDSLNFLIDVIPHTDLRSELYTVIQTLSIKNTIEQRYEGYIKAATIITNILYDDIPLEQFTVFADAILHCFHQADILSRKKSRISKNLTRKLVWKCVQMAYTELLRLGTKNYLSYELERITLLDDLAYLCHLFADVCDQATVTICMIEAARARIAVEKLDELNQRKAYERLKEIDDHLLECRRLQKLHDLRSTTTKRTIKLKRLWKFLFRRLKLSM